MAKSILKNYYSITDRKGACQIGLSTKINASILWTEGEARLTKEVHVASELAGNSKLI